MSLEKIAEMGPKDEDNAPVSPKPECDDEEETESSDTATTEGGDTEVDKGIVGADIENQRKEIGLDEYELMFFQDLGLCDGDGLCPPALIPKGYLRVAVQHLIRQELTKIIDLNLANAARVEKEEMEEE